VHVRRPAIVFRFWTYSFVLAVRILKGLVHAMIANLCKAKNRLWLYEHIDTEDEPEALQRYEDIPSYHIPRR
jgi:hypothetical protein